MTEIKYPALFIAHWPGKDTPVCAIHAAKIKAIVQSMGFDVSLTPVLLYEIECENCLNEEKSTEGGQR